jgi:hypothetical protein
VLQALLEQRRDQLRAEGYAAMIDRSVAEAQMLPPSARVPVGQHGESVSYPEYVAGLKKKESNCYAAARVLQALLEQLPAEPEPA